MSSQMFWPWTIEVESPDDTFCDDWKAGGYLPFDGVKTLWPRPSSAGSGHRFVKPSKTIEAGDEWYCCYQDMAGNLTAASWLAFGIDDIGQVILPNWGVVRRKATKAPTGPRKWSCRHKRMDDEDHCSVCLALYFRKVTD